MPYVKPGANRKVANLDDGPVPRMIDPRISPRILFLNIQYVHDQRMTKPSYDWPGSHLDFFFLKTQHVHGQKMFDPPPQYDRPGSHLEF